MAKKNIVCSNNQWSAGVVPAANDLNFEGGPACVGLYNEQNFQSMLQKRSQMGRARRKM